MDTGRHVKLFRNGRTQVVRIPREFALPGQDAIIRKDGRCLIIEPAAPTNLIALLRALEPIKDRFPAHKDLPADPVDL